MPEAKKQQEKEKEQDTGSYPQRFVHPSGSEGFPKNAEDAAALREAGFKPAKD